MEIERPLDMLGNLKGKEVLVKCKAYKEYEVEGILHAFDMHINLVLEIQEDRKETFRSIRGDNVVFIEESA